MPLNEEQLKALGRVCVTFQAIEVRLAFVTWSLISNEQAVGRIITPLLSFAKLCDLASMLISHRFPGTPLADELHQIIRRVSELEQERNTLIHSAWAYRADRPEVEGERVKITVKRYRGVRVDCCETPAAQINGIADQMQEATESLDTLVRNWIALGGR
jgi:hypothetical protein